MHYVVAEMSIHDRDRYDRYARQFLQVLRPFSGRLLAADERPVTIEGDWRVDKVVLLEFPDRAAYHAWASSPEYRRIAEDRLASTSGHALLVAGIDGSAERPQTKLDTSVEPNL